MPTWNATLMARLLWLTVAIFPLLVERSEAQEKLGKVSFPTSCDAAAQAQFERGVAMLHSYWFTQARKTFEAVLERDPGCAIAYWGIALDLLGNTLAAPPAPAAAKAAREALDKARALGAKTEREREWIEALGAYYRDFESTPVEERLRAYRAAMEKLAQRYPDDFEAQVFYALALQAAASPSDKSYRDQLRSAAILEKLFERNPEHPGVSHFLIHAYDYPALAERGMAAARRYAGLAPAAPHALHMPSHIYSMAGSWHESIASNRASLEVDPLGYHQMDFIVYAQLQLAQDAAARAILDHALGEFGAGKRGGGSALGQHTATAAMPARHALERADWQAAARLPLRSTQFPAADAITRFARGLGMARSGDLAGARGEVEALQALRAALVKSGQSYWVARADEQIDAVSAWIAHREGKTELALRAMRAAADSEDASIKHVAMENRLLPLRELLAEMLLERGDAAAALREFEASSTENPNRYRGLYGAARAAEASGERGKARQYYARLVDLAKSADTRRPELERASAYPARP